MKWRKLGRIYVADGSLAWALSHAFPPTPRVINDDVIRLYVAFCDAETVGRVGYVDVAADNPLRVLRVSERPVLDIGAPGTFDENGVLPTALVDVDGRLYLYYVGFQQGRKAPYHQFEGLATSDDGGESFARAQRVPILDRSDTERTHRSSAFVRRRNGTFQMWYAAGNDWTTVNSKTLPMYNIRYAESPDGIQWPREGRPLFEFAGPDEHAIGRPFVVERHGRERLFYSVRTRSKGYRIGYADAQGDGWNRKDASVGIDVSPGNGWDSETVSYAAVIESAGRTFMFYNGNGCGRTGFGCAVLEEW